jgi:ubiquinone/menaquinone biosynthesis C-methylase UbiE/uncharacterized protein YbaR (Trm112 family)
MGSRIKLPEKVLSSLRCPICLTSFDGHEGELQCLNESCKTTFPFVEDIPILINEKNSIFSISDFTAQKQTTLELKKNNIRDLVSRLLPNIDENKKAKQNYALFTELLLQECSSPKVLVIGCGNLGKGLELLVKEGNIQLIETDVSLGDRTAIICDAHDLPFDDESFDGVIIQAVLEHVVDPYRCVDEISRVLKFRGVVYAETPFMQQVHMGRFDFTRFTHLGHRRLFRKFVEIESGAVGGPGMALAWSYQYFLLSFTKSQFLRSAIKLFTRLTSFYLQHFDNYLINQSGAFDAASGYYFLGQKDGTILSDRELIKLYKGNIL